MRQLFKDREHLVRVALLGVGGLLLFFLMKSIFVPADFGIYGHFRAGALDDNRARPMCYAGRQACTDCHDDVVQARQGSKHAGIGCETCHGPLAKHAADPTAMTPELPDKRALCLNCHSENVARPRSFPQINPKDHGDTGPCTGCHNPHHPEMDEPAPPSAAATPGPPADPHASGAVPEVKQ